jgi:ketosteroid isomerase-like protein
MSNTDTVRALYAAFGQKDVPTILDKLTDDIDWDYTYEGTGVPWLTRRRGRQGVVEFVQSLAGFSLRKFDVKGVFDQGNVVLALLDVSGVVTATGRPIVEQDEVHLWHFDDSGKVSRFRHVSDTLQHWRALQA